MATTRDRVTFHKQRQRMPIPGQVRLTYALWEARDADTHDVVALYDADHPESSWIFDEPWPRHGYMAWREAVRAAAGPR
jgi:hypothetical protein